LEFCNGGGAEKQGSCPYQMVKNLTILIFNWIQYQTECDGRTDGRTDLFVCLFVYLFIYLIHSWTQCK